jgi:hypothetical protein
MYFICCRILGIKPGSDEETIKAAYRKSAKELHPDINTSEKAHEYFVILQNAYEYLLTHKYSEEEIEILWHQHEIKRDRGLKNDSNVPTSQRIRSDRYTLREVLKQSLTARVLYILFHILFIFVGIWLIANSIYEMFFFTPDDRIDFFSAYITIFFGLVMGISFTTIFLITGITFIRDR